MGASKLQSPIEWGPAPEGGRTGQLPLALWYARTASHFSTKMEGFYGTMAKLASSSTRETRFRVALTEA